MAGSSECLACSVDWGFTRKHPEAIALWKEHAAAQFPNEACGFLMADGRFLAVPNTHPDPRGFFDVSIDDQLDVRAEGTILAFLHSHTDGPELDRRGGLAVADVSPSADDMVSQQQSGYAWGISRVGPGGAHDPVWFGDELGRLPLIGRTFLHGVHDCMALIRDWHAERGITTIPNQPRDNGWWDRGQNLYEDNLLRGGFRRVQRVAPMPGDVFLCRIPQKVAVLNHGGVFLGDNVVMHHLPGRLSIRDHAHLWHTKLDFLVRHVDLPEEIA